MLEAAGRNILVVEDDPVMQAYFKWIIRSIDSTIGVDCVASGEEAVAHLEKAKQKHSFDLIIADQILEGKKTGVDVWEHCRRDHLESPILLTSSSDVRPLISEKAKRLGSKPPFLFKPFSNFACQDMIKQLLNKKSETIASGGVGILTQKLESHDIDTLPSSLYGSRNFEATLNIIAFLFVFVLIGAMESYLSKAIDPKIFKEEMKIKDRVNPQTLPLFPPKVPEKTIQPTNSKDLFLALEELRVQVDLVNKQADEILKLATQPTGEIDLPVDKD